MDSSSPTFTQCGIDSNIAYFSGGGVYCENNSNPEFTSCHIESNTTLAIIGAGGVYCDGSSPELSECDIKYNTATHAGGVLCINSSSPTFTKCQIDSNSAYYSCGGILCQESSSPSFDKCTIRGNSASGIGGGIGSANSDPRVTNCIIIGNTAESGGGVLCNGTAGTFEFCTLSDNVANGLEARGGGVYCELSTTIFNSIIITCSRGSGIYFEESPGCQVEYCDFFGNTGGDIAFCDDNPAHGPPVIDAIIANPFFVDREAGDFHLNDYSPCIGEANPEDYPDDDFYEDNPQRPDPLGTVPDIGADENGNGEPITSVEDIETLPTSYSLSQNWPNPFNPITQIEYALPERCHVKLIIYNVRGQKVMTLVDEEQSPGYKAVRWNARNQTGNEVASGIYFYRLEAGSYIKVEKMLLLK